MKITVPLIPPSLNHFAGRKNDREYQQAKREWKDLVCYCAPKQEKPFSKSVVTITYFFRDKRRRDPDNYSGKMIMDGLTAAGIIRDDSFDCVELRIVGNCDRQNPRTEITIEEVV